MVRCAGNICRAEASLVSGSLVPCSNALTHKLDKHTHTQAEKKGWGCEPCLCMQTATNHSSCQGQKRAMIQSLEPDPWWTRPLTDLVYSPLTNHVFVVGEESSPCSKIPDPDQ